MVKTILGRKLGMTQVWSEDDRLVPVTVIEAGPVRRLPGQDARSATATRAVQIGFGDIKEKKVNKPMAGHFAKAGVDAEAPPRRGAPRRGRRAQARPDRSRSSVFEAGEVGARHRHEQG